MLHKKIIKDVYNKNVKVGSKVCLLVKIYGYNGIDRAYLRHCKYLGKGQWGYEFEDIKRFPHSIGKCIWRFRNPEMVLIK